MKYFCNALRHVHAFLLSNILKITTSLSYLLKPVIDCNYRFSPCKVKSLYMSLFSKRDKYKKSNKHYLILWYLLFDILCNTYWEIMGRNTVVPTACLTGPDRSLYRSILCHFLCQNRAIQRKQSKQIWKSSSVEIPWQKFFLKYISATEAKVIIWSEIHTPVSKDKKAHETGSGYSHI